MAGGRKVTQHLLCSGVQQEESYLNQNSRTKDYKKEEVQGGKGIKKEGKKEIK